MIIYTDSVREISPAQIQGFFVGWKNPLSPEKHLVILKNSYLRILAVDGDSKRVVGFINAISDGSFSAYIPLLEVLPEFQNRGIGSRLLRMMLDRLRDFYMVDLTCDAGRTSFYSKFGFIDGTAMMLRNYEHRFRDET
ncbi:putative acetyltransferase [Candidatus Zixiibacteriota bacterium]|nr:putative acetyltransferase [candidate division Zixibacteria bacterium]